MLNVIVRWTVVEGHPRMHNSGSHLAADTAPVVTNFCESQLRHIHSPVHSNGPHTMATNASNTTFTMTPAHSVGVGQSASPVDLLQPRRVYGQPMRPLTCALFERHNQDGIGRSATQHPSIAQSSSAAKRTKVANGVAAAWRVTTS